MSGIDWTGVIVSVAVAALSFSVTVEAAGTKYCDGELREVRIDYFNFWQPFLALGDVGGDGRVTGRDALVILQAANGTRTVFPAFDVDGSADELGNGAVTAIDALLTLRRAVGGDVPAHVLDIAALRCEMTRWLVAHQNDRGLIEFAPAGLRLAATYDQGVAGLAALSQLRMVRRGLDRECTVTTSELLGVVQKTLRFYVDAHRNAVEAGGFHGFAEFYDPDTGEPEYGVGAGGNVVGPTAYVMALAAQAYGTSRRSLGGDLVLEILEMAVGIAQWWRSLARADGGLPFGVTPEGRPVPTVSTEHNLSARDALTTLISVLAELADERAEDLLCFALGIDAFLAAELWNPALHRFAAGFDANGVRDDRVFTDVFALAALSPFALPGEYAKGAFLTAANLRLRTVKPFDLNPAVTIDGYGSFDRSGIQNEWTAQMSFAFNALLNRYPQPANRTPMWRSAYFLRQLARARIDAGTHGAGLAQAAAAHDSGFGGFRWDSSAIAPASIAWWVMTSLDFHPFILQTDDLHTD